MVRFTLSLVRNSIAFLLFAFASVTLAGCEPESLSPENRLVVINFTTGSLSDSMLKSATEAEKEITKIKLFGVAADNSIFETYPDIVGLPSSGVPITISRKVKTLYAIANPSVAMEAELSTISDLSNLVGVFDEPQSPYLMGGQISINGSESEYGNNISIELIRAVAKVKITGKNGFQIETVTVTNTPDGGYVFKKAEPSVPATANMISYPVITSGAPIVYVAENTTQSSTKFVVTGTFNSKQASYTIVLKQEGQAIDIARNHYYQVAITPITKDECTTTISIPEWSEEDTDDYVIPRPNPYKDGIKILAIGNSFSQNSMQYVYDLLKQLGVDENNQGKIKLVNVYKGGASLNYHATGISNGTLYERQTFGAGGAITGWTSAVYTLFDLITQDAWDVITLQQASDHSENKDSYNADLDVLINYVKANALNPNVKLGWHMTWGYDNTLRYDPRAMYDKICSAVKERIATNDNFDFIIPTGTAIQNARSYFNFTLNRDGSHLNNLGCYIAAAMWVKTITGYDIGNLRTPYTVSSTYNGTTTYTIEGTMFDNVVQSVNAAANRPFESP